MNLFRFLEFAVPPSCECEDCSTPPQCTIVAFIDTEIHYTISVCRSCYPHAIRTIHEAMIAAGGTEVVLPAAHEAGN